MEYTCSYKCVISQAHHFSHSVYVHIKEPFINYGEVGGGKSKREGEGGAKFFPYTKRGVGKSSSHVDGGGGAHTSFSFLILFVERLYVGFW